jgi:alpha-1,6-mannosyltransferase
VLSRGWSGSVLVLLGGLVVSTLPRSTPVLHWDGLGEALRTLRGHEVTRVLALVVVLVGLALLATVWCCSAGRCRGSRRGRA